MYRWLAKCIYCLIYCTKRTVQFRIRNLNTITSTLHAYGICNNTHEWRFNTIRLTEKDEMYVYSCVSVCMYIWGGIKVLLLHQNLVYVRRYGTIRKQRGTWYHESTERQEFNWERLSFEGSTPQVRIHCAESIAIPLTAIPLIYTNMHIYTHKYEVYTYVYIYMHCVCISVGVFLYIWISWRAALRWG